MITGRRLSYSVMVDTKIGPGALDWWEGHRRSDPGLVGSASMMILQVRNTGLRRITTEDYESPLTFDFGGRTVLAARVDASNSNLRVTVVGGAHAIEVGAVELCRNRGFDLALLLVGNFEGSVRHRGSLRAGRIAFKPFD
ncbi:hypothetical protein [Saccharothrix sp. NRRL B-16314]|uniref:hypothetical protein n=1 Tax=Saccharothrix sp. NRRL B-16314 TaxID=1463825 RepID=UPI000527820C|nr:hypothetical protein [Saccharothrix sp. NRRL B-16314]